MKIDDLILLAPPVDPLSETTRRERKSLLTANLIAISLTVGNLIPSQISALGVALDAKEQGGFLGVLLLVNLYFFVAFLVYGIPEWQRSHAQDQLFRKHLGEFVRTPSGSRSAAVLPQPSDIERLADALHGARVAASFLIGRKPRIVIDFLVPIVATGWATSLLLAKISGRSILDNDILSNPISWVSVAWSIAGVAGVVVWKRREARLRKPSESAEKLTLRFQPLADLVKLAKSQAPGSPEHQATLEKIKEVAASISKPSRK